MAELTDQQRRLMTTLTEHPESVTRDDQDQVHALLTHSDVAVRRKTVRALERELKAVGPNLIHALREPLTSKLTTQKHEADAITKRQTIELLGRTLHHISNNGPTSIAEIEPYIIALNASLADESNRVCRRASSVVGRLALTESPAFPVRRFQTTLVEIVDNPEHDCLVTSVAAQALGYTGVHGDAETAVRVLVPCISSSEDFWLCVGALRGLAEVGTADPTWLDGLIEAVVPLAFHERYPVRTEAIWTLERWRTETYLSGEALETAVEEFLFEKEEPFASPHITLDNGILKNTIRRFHSRGVLNDMAILNLLDPYLQPEADPARRLDTVTVLGRVGRNGSFGVNGEDISKRVVTRLSDLIKDESADVREATTEALESIGRTDPDAVGAIVAPLINSLTDPDPDVRRQAAAAIGTISEVKPDPIQETVDDLIKLLERNQSDTATRGSEEHWFGEINGQVADDQQEASNSARQIAAELLGSIGRHYPEPVIKPLCFTLYHGDSDVQETAKSSLESIARHHPEEVAQPLMPLFNSNDPKVRAAAASITGCINADYSNANEQIVGTLMSALTDEHSDVRRSAIYGLHRVGRKNEDVTEAIIERLTDIESGVRCSAAQVLGRIEFKEKVTIKKVIRALSGTLVHDETEVCAVAANSLGDIGNEHPELVESSVRPLIDSLDSDELRVRREAAKALGQIGSDRAQLVESAVKPLISEFTKTEDSEWLISNYEAAFALAKIGSNQPELVEGVVSRLNTAVTDNSRPSMKLIEAIGEIGQQRPGWFEPAIKALVVELEDGLNEWSRGAAADTLGKIGSQEPGVVEPAVGNLIAALNEEDPHIRRNATVALARIGWEPTLWARLPIASYYCNAAPITKSLAQLAPTAPNWILPLQSELETLTGEESRQFHEAAIATLAKITQE